MKATLKRQLKFKDPARGIIPAGTDALIRFNHSVIAEVEFFIGDRIEKARVNCSKLPSYFPDDFESPSMEQLEAWVYDGTCETVTGETTEPDGYGPDGSPSWLLALGLI